MKAWLDTGCYLLERRLLAVHNRRFVRSHIQCATNIRHQLTQRRHSPGLGLTPLTVCRDASSIPRSKHRTNRPRAKSNGRQRGNEDNTSTGVGSKSISRSDENAPTNNTKEKVRKSADFPRAEEVGEQEFRKLVSKPQQMLETTLQDLGRLTRSVGGGRKQYRSTLSMTWRDTNKESIHAVGDGANADQATVAAWFHLVAILHKAGELVPLLAQAPLPVDADLAKREQNALIEVYEYCVRHGQLPVIDRKPRRSRTRLTWQTTITFAGQNINVTAASKNSLDADLLAAVKFKTAAEAYQKQQGTTSLVVRAEDSLNVENSEQFLKFYTYASGKKSQLLSMESKPIDKQRFEFYGEMDGELVGSPVIAGNRKIGEKLAYLVAAHTLLSRQPELKPKFFQALKKGNGNIILPMKPLDLPVGAHVALRMQNTLLEARQNGLADEYEPLLAESTSKNDSAFPRPQMTESELQERNEHLQSMRQTYQTSEKTEAMRKVRADLPMTAYAESVLDIIDNNTYSIIIGETGSGKTTQVPQILMDHYVDAGNGTACNIICTQPRRIAATSVARRVADERGEPLKASVGYMVRGDYQACNKSGNINYVTTGTLLAQLQNDPDDILDRVSHIILDEVHERDRFIDYTMIILKEVLSHRLANGKSAPRVTLMSATLDPELFAPYFSNRRADGSEGPTPVLRVPGRTFPVKEMYLEDVYGQLSSQHDGQLARYANEDKSSREFIQLEKEFVHEQGGGSSDFGKVHESSRRVIDWKRTSTSTDGARKSLEDLERDESLVPVQLVAATIAHVAMTTTEGAILVFLPGLDEIQVVERLLKSQTMFEYNEDKFATFMLHSSIAGNAQANVFEPCPPGKRKIILSTNIAETSVTIPDVQHVIDTGKHREVHYNQLRRLTALRCTWISKSNAKQRAGRGGRVQNGNYYALYSKCRRDKMRAVGLPELLRTDLQETCLEIFAQKWRIDPRDFLAKAIEPPDPVAIESSISNLLAIEALTSDEQITPLGRLLFTLPIHPELGKMLVYGIILRCLYPMIVIGAAAQNRSLFVAALGADRERLDRVKFYFGEGQESDHLVILNAFKKVRQIQRAEGSVAAQRFARANYIHWGAYKSIESTAALIEGALVSSGIIPDERSGRAAAGSASLNENANKSYLIKALTVAGLYPKVAVKSSPGTYHWRTETEAAVALHPTSLNDNRQSRADGAVFATFDQLARTADGTGLNARTSTLVSPLAIALFGGRLSARDEGNADEESIWNRARSTTTGRVVVVDEWLPFFVISQNRNAPHILIELRKALQRMLVQAYADLSKRQPLADDPVRAGFAKHLVEILRLDPHTVRLSDRQPPVKRIDPSFGNSGDFEDRGEPDFASDPAASFGGSFVNTRVRSGPSGRPGGQGSFHGERRFTPPKSNGEFNGVHRLNLNRNTSPGISRQPRR